MIPIHPSGLPTLFQEARKLHVAGKLEQARERYQTILKVKPDFAGGHFQLAQVLARLGDLRQSIVHLGRAADLKPEEPDIWQGYAEIADRLGDPSVKSALLARARAARIDKKLLLGLQDKLQGTSGKSRPSIGNAPAAEVKRAISFLQKRQFQDAATLAGRLRKAHPKVALIADILANAQAATGKPDRAEKNFRAAIGLDPKYAETHSNFGRFLVERGRYDEGIAELRTALELAPKMVHAWVHLGVALKRKFMASGAIPAFRKALALDPENTAALYGLGEVLANEQRPEEAIGYLGRARSRGADRFGTTILIARCTAGLGREDEALGMLDGILPEAPDRVGVLSAKAMILQAQGRFDDARLAFHEAIALRPRVGRFYRTWLTTEKLAADDPLIAQMQAAFNDPEVSDNDRINFGFALARALEDSGQYDRVFTYLKPACDLMRKACPFNFDALREQTHAVMDSLRDVDFQAIDLPGRSGYAPVFVTGLPRSGTTLVEQIVASHSIVTGGGELGNARRIWGDALIGSHGDVRSWVSVGKARIAGIGHEVEARMRALFGNAARVTDKSVQSYLMIGPIRASLPNARFVVVRRDPRDNLLSMYKNMFAAGKHLHSYDLRDLARYYRLFEEIIDFWRARLPGWFHEIRYEELIVDPEAEARKLIAACGLDWEDACLGFHENRRRVDTLSVHQVRQPIYSSSIQAWRRYESELTEMLEELGGEYAPGA